MFRGISSILMDSKGRLAVPTKYRDAIQTTARNQIVLTVDHIDRCLLLYPLDQWMLVEQTLITLPNTHPRVRMMQRLVLGYATESELDAQGRFVLPTPLRDYANLDKKVVLVGQINKFEIWNADSWATACDKWLGIACTDSSHDNLFEQVSL